MWRCMCMAVWCLLYVMMTKRHCIYWNALYHHLVSLVYQYNSVLAYCNSMHYSYIFLCINIYIDNIVMLYHWKKHIIRNNEVLHSLNLSWEKFEGKFSPNFFPNHWILKSQFLFHPSVYIYSDIMPATKRVGPSKKKTTAKFVIDCELPAADGFLDVAEFEKFLHDRIKVDGKAGNLQGKIQIAREKSKVRTLPSLNRILQYCSLYSVERCCRLWVLQEIS